VSDTRHVSLEAEPAEAVYVTPAQWYFADVVRWLVVRAEGDAGALVPALRQAVWSVDGNQPIVRTQTMDALVQRSEARRRFVLIVLESFALVALMLAGVGLYGVLSGSVTERMPEIGLRAALGASRTSILGLVVRQGMTVTAIGVAIGLAGAAAASRALVALLFGVSRLDAVTYLAVVALLGSVAALACWIPAARAARADPLATLRAE
jgi:ABC-type antimicrobial peptide transport system permease subunit